MQLLESDLIIAGGGLAGLSLAYRLVRSEVIKNNIVVIDRDPKTTNDHTWCFWETGDSLFEEVVFRSWDRLHFHGPELDEIYEIAPYRYKMVRASDFYAKVLSVIDKDPRAEFVQADIESISEEAVRTDKGIFEGFVFDSVTLPSYDDPIYINLLQPFLGFVVKTKDYQFDVEQFTMFDFGVEQRDDCRFVYVLPLSEDEALIEYTLFTSSKPDDEYLRSQLDTYIRENFGNHQILEEESGVIPMSNVIHEDRPFSNVMRIGGAAGWVKPSTGYSFQRTQRRLDLIVRSLESSMSERTLPRRHEFQVPWKSFLDTVLLEVLANNKHPADDIFSRLFRRNGATQMLRFLDEDTSFTEDLRLMSTVPLLPFSRSAIKVLFKKLIL